MDINSPANFITEDLWPSDQGVSDFIIIIITIKSQPVGLPEFSCLLADLSRLSPAVCLLSMAWELTLHWFPNGGKGGLETKQ